METIKWKIYTIASSEKWLNLSLPYKLKFSAVF